MGSPVRRIVREQPIQPARARPSRQPILPFRHPIAGLAELDRVGGNGHGTHYLASDLERPAGTRNRAILRDKIRAIDVLTPDDLRERNPNTASGNPYAGPGELDQSFPWRPLPSSGRNATRSAALAHRRLDLPGSGLAGSAGHLVATTLTRRRAWRR
jgi:hypothetical protein